MSKIMAPITVPIAVTMVLFSESFQKIFIQVMFAEAIVHESFSPHCPLPVDNTGNVISIYKHIPFPHVPMNQSGKTDFVKYMLFFFKTFPELICITAKIYFFLLRVRYQICKHFAYKI
jgi:hypothetical protein